METKELMLPAEIPAVFDSHLTMGGTTPDGVRYGVNNRYLTKNGAPWIPVMGEFHFSRYPREEWRGELLKMKALGVTIVASYVFWIHHEEIRGEWDWRGNKDLAAFTQLIKELELLFWLRVGPWPHGEARNGGFPDWLMVEEQNGMVLRSDDPAYLACVKELYEQIGRQIGADADVRRGGPIAGVQIENEYGHCGGPGSDDHIRTLMKMAVRAGITAPFTSVTGWGGANIPQDEVLPVMGGYPAHPWTQHTNPLGPMEMYLFKPLANDPRIGGDLAAGGGNGENGLTWKTDRTPFLTCELGGGIQVTGHRRPWLSHGDVSSLALCSLGSGCNMPGYYMFHGGTNPTGQNGFTQESRDTGSPNDVPRLSYDFQAMIGEFGNVRPSGKRSKLFHYFLRDFGSLLAPMDPVFPDSSPADPQDRENLRWSVRTDGTSGFLFINNHSRRQELPEQGVKFVLKGASEEIRIPPLSIPSGAYGFIPFNMPLKTERGEVLIKKGTVQPVCRLNDGGEEIVFFHNFTAAPGSISLLLPGEREEWIFPFPEESSRFTVAPGLAFHILSAEEGESFWMGETAGIKTYCLSPGTVLFDKGKTYILEESRDERNLPFSSSVQGRYEIPLREIGEKLSRQDEVYLTFDLVCDKAELTLDGRLICDFFYYGDPWLVGLKRFASLIKAESKLELTLKSPEPSDEIYFECPRPVKAELREIGVKTVSKREIS